MSKATHAVLWILAAVSPGALAVDWIGPVSGDKPVTTRNIEALLREQPLVPGENIKPLPLHRGEHTSHLLVQIRDREPVHYHADSDITVLMLRGTGTIHSDQHQLPAKTGDILFIPRGEVHYFVNAGKEPAAALVIYSPPPGPNDRVLVDTKR